MDKWRSAFGAAFLSIMVSLVIWPVPALAEDCTGGPGPGLLPFDDCTLDEDTTGALTVDGGVILTISAGGLAPAPLVIGHTINGHTAATKGRIETEGNGGLIHQAADIGDINSIDRLTIGNGDIWYISNDADLILEPLSNITLNGGILGIGPDSALSMISAGIMGSAGTDIIDFISGGVSIGTTGTIGRTGQDIDLGDGDDRFVYYQSVGSTINADQINMGAGNDFMGIRGSGNIFAGDFFTLSGDDTLAFISGSTATFGALTSVMNMAAGNDLIDFDSGGGAAGGALQADRLILHEGNDTVLLADNASMQIATSFDSGEGDDLISFTSGGFIDVTGAAFTMGEGEDTIRFNAVGFAAGVSGIEAANSDFSMGAGNDTIVFYSNRSGINAAGTAIELGDDDDVITFLSSSGPIDMVDGNGLFGIDGGTGLDRIFFGSAAAVTYGSAGTGGDITNVEIIDIGHGTLSFEGTVDDEAAIINFVSASFFGANTDVLAFLSSDGMAGHVTFASGASFGGTAELGGGDDGMIFNSGGVLDAAGAANLGAGDDSFAAGGGAVIAGTVDGGGQVNDALTFLSGMTTVTGSIISFSSGEVHNGATVNISGGGSVAVDLYGAGTVQFGSAGSVADTYEINNAIDGVMLEIIGDSVNAHVMLGQITALSGLTVHSGTVLRLYEHLNVSGGALDVEGTLRLSPDSEVAANSYDNTPGGGTFIFEVGHDGAQTSVGSIDLVGAGQNIDFSSATGAGNSFHFTLGPGTSPLVTDSVSFINAGAGGTATAPEAANITGSNILYEFAVRDDNAAAQDLELVITQINTIENLTDTANNTAMANLLLVDLLNSSDADIVALREAVLDSANGEEFNQKLAAVSPVVNGAEVAGIREVNTQTFGLINQRLALLRQDAGGATGINTGNLTEELEAWWQFFGGMAKQDNRAGIDGYDSATYGMAAGVDKELFDNGFFGLSFAWGDTTSSAKGPGDGESNVDSYLLSAYGDYDFGRLYLNTMLSYGYNDIYTARTSALGKRSGKYHANYYAARSEIGYSFMPGKTRIIPYLMGYYGYYSPESYAEEGPGAQIVSTDSLKTMQLGGGVNLSWLIKNDVHSYFIPEMHVGYRYDFSGEPASTTARFFAGGPAIELQGFTPSEHTMDFGLGMSYFSQDDWELIFKYDLEYKEDYRAHAGMIRASYKFQH